MILLMHADGVFDERSSHLKTYALLAFNERIRPWRPRAFEMLARFVNRHPVEDCAE